MSQGESPDPEMPARHERVRHETEARLRAAELANHQLERELATRTAQLETASRELESFAYSVSHDLRAPLRHIDGFASMLAAHAESSLDDKGRRYLTVIVESARRMGRLIDDLLAFSRIGRAEMSPRRCNVADLVTNARTQLRETIADRAIEWEIGPLPDIVGDQALLFQAVVNLLDNAIKFTRPRPSARIEIGTQPGAENEVVIYFRDNGVGFNPKYVDQLFGVFQRLHAESEFEGTGVGLANVQRIVRRHGGRVWADGQVDAGATFYVALPRVDMPIGL